MHKGIILLVKATSREEVLPAVKDFMEPYGDGDVWDWYVIGGRWSGTLNPLNEQFEKEVKKSFPPKEKFGYTVEELKNLQPKLQNLWAKLGGEGKNPFDRNNYSEEGTSDDILPLKECLSVVKAWVQDPEKVSKQTLKEGKKSLKRYENDPKLKRRMEGYYLEKAGQILRENFCFDTNVFNIDSHSYELPDQEQIDEFFAVMVDMHN